MMACVANSLCPARGFSEGVTIMVASPRSSSSGVRRLTCGGVVPVWIEPWRKVVQREHANQHQPHCVMSLDEATALRSS
jgi:hypothetical protein